MIIACHGCGLQYDVRAYPEGTQLQCRCQTVFVVPAHVVTTIRCPSCGGTADASAVRCQFCQSLISRKTCPTCAAAVREEAKFCDQCGGTLRAITAETTKATGQNCPRCKVPLFAQTCSGYPVAACAECLGMWISHEVLEHIYKDAPRQLARLLPGSPSVDNPLEAQGRLGKNAAAYIPCPHCGKIMNPTNYARRSGVIIDICREHGIWFDADELNKVLEYHARGGVNDAAERDREAAKAAVRDLRIAQASALGDKLKVQSHGSSLFGSALRGLLRG